MNVDPIGTDRNAPPSPTVEIDGKTQGSSWFIRLLNQIQYAITWLWASGPTAKRPTDPVLGQLFYDTTIPGTVVCTAVRAGATPATWSVVGGSMRLVAAFTAGQSGNVTLPAGLYWAKAIGGGASGSGHTANGTGAGATGGSAEYCIMLPLYSDGTAWTYNVAAGVAGTTGNGAGNAGNPTTLTGNGFNLTLLGAPAVPAGTNNPGGNGGGRKGPAGGASGGGVGLDSVQEGVDTWSGASAAGNSVITNGVPAGNSGQSECFTNATPGQGDGTNRGSAASPSSMFGLGANGVSAVAGNSTQGTDATSPGTSGTGCSGGIGNLRGGNSAGGRIEIYG